jgi:hypothetical protein
VTSDIFHSITAKILFFLCKRGRPDVQVPIAFLCTRVQAPDVDDYKKLRRVVNYLRETKKLYLTLEAENLQMIKWWVDASFAVHHDMRSHTGGVMSLGKGAIYSTSTRHKLNTKSSTEAELVGVDDVMPMILWTRQFMEGQGYTIRDNVVYQDNQSSMLLANHGQQSSTKRTRHLDIRYYFVTDRIRAKQLRIEYCPTGDMWADIHTKPLQGATFAKFRRLILNLPEGPVELGLGDPSGNPSTGSQECVGNTTKGDGDDRTRLEARVHAGTCVPSVGKDPRLKSSGKNAGSNSYF